jgi:hypothetical protein
MKNNISHKIIVLLLCCYVINGCSETYVLQTNTYEEALVVEATITNELKKQEIKISKTSPFEDVETKMEYGADVYITDNEGNKYDFEDQSGIYVSQSEFQAVPGREYHLNIITSDGKSYESSTESLSAVNSIENINATVETNDGQRGVAINVNSYDPTGEAKYYRYEYEETYKIIAPKWNSTKAIVVSPTELDYVPNSEDTKTCYSTKNSTELILTSTIELNEDRLNFPVRFISDQNYIIGHRYSILVTQYVESLAAYTYYKTLQKISGSGSILSPKQPGFLYGNLKSVNNPNEKVIGFFDVASVSLSKRFYFNYVDLFPGDELPPYFDACELQNVLFCFGYPPCAGPELVMAIENHTLTYGGHVSIDHYMYKPQCGDCTSFSSNIKPSFWED